MRKRSRERERKENRDRRKPIGQQKSMRHGRPRVIGLNWIMHIQNGLKKARCPNASGVGMCRVGATDGGHVGNEGKRQALKVLLDLFQRQGRCALALPRLLVSRIRAIYVRLIANAYRVFTQLKSSHIKLCFSLLFLLVILPFLPETAKETRIA